MPATTKYLEKQIPAIFYQIVGIYCRKIMRSVKSTTHKMVSADVQDLILFFFAKPMQMNFEYNEMKRHILICPVRGNWAYLQSLLIRELFPNAGKVCIYEGTVQNYQDLKIQLKGDNETMTEIAKDEWVTCRWNHQIDEFLIEGSLEQKDPTEMNLEVHKHRGHTFNNHPSNLLVKDDNKQYLSNFRNPSSDWIIFKVKEQASFMKSFCPTKLNFKMSMNHTHSASIKSIIVSWSEEGVIFRKWTDVKIPKSETRYEHKFDEEQSRTVIGRLRYIKLDIVENHGSNLANGFKEFAVCGFRDEDNQSDFL